MLVHPAMQALTKKAKKILIIGGGDGAVAEEVLKYNYVRKIDLVDIDKEVVDLSKKYFKKINNNSLVNKKLNLFYEDAFKFIDKNQNSYEFSIGDVRNIDIEDNSQDLVICSEVLEHVPNFKDVLKECYRILKPGAVMLISVPSYLPESLCWKYSKEYMQTPGGHIRIFKKAFLKECFEELNLKVFKYHREHAIHSIYWILKARNNMQEDKFLKSLHALLVRQMFGQAKISLFIEKMLNPFFGKSECFYLRK